MLNGIARPFGVLLMFLYNLVNNYGVSIILFALVIKAILLPFQMKSKRGMMQQARLQPKIAEIQKKHGTNKAKINEETMKLYKEAGVSPASGCIWGFLPLPIMLALYQVIRQPITTMMGIAAEMLQEGGAIYAKLISIPGFDPASLTSTYGQIKVAQTITDNFDRFQGVSDQLSKINFSFLNIDLSITPQWNFLWSSKAFMDQNHVSWLMGFVLFLIPLISGGMQFLATQLNRKMNPPVAVEGQAKSMNTMMMLMPLISVYIAFITPAALGLYWTISTVFQIVQDVWLTKVYTKKIEAEEAVKNAEREKKEAELEAKRLETERRKAEGLVERNPNTAKRKKQKSGKQEQLEKASEWQKKRAPDEDRGEYEPSRVGNRRYARGRAYDPDRYAGISGETSDIALEEAAEGVPDDIADTDIVMIEAGGQDSSPDSGGGIDSEYDDDEYEDDEYEDDSGADDDEENDDEEYDDEQYADEDDDEDYEEYDDEDDDDDYEEYDDEDDNDNDDDED